VGVGADRIEPADEPWLQQLLKSLWLLAGAALLFFTLSYVVWGLIDLVSIASGVTMESPIEPPQGDWWSEKVNRRETIWLGISGLWAMTLFGWMAGWTQFGEQNQIGKTLEVSTDRYRERVTAFADRATETERGLVPPDTDVHVGAFRYGFDGLPAVLETGTEYTFHPGTYDVQHGFSVRQEDTLSKQLSLQMLPGYEWLMPMEFDEPGTYHVVCNDTVGHK